MWKQLSQFTHKARWKIHSFALGSTFAIGAASLGQGCTAGGA